MKKHIEHCEFESNLFKFEELSNDEKGKINRGSEVSDWVVYLIGYLAGSYVSSRHVPHE